MKKEINNLYESHLNLQNSQQSLLKTLKENGDNGVEFLRNRISELENKLDYEIWYRESVEERLSIVIDMAGEILEMYNAATEEIKKLKEKSD